MPPVTVAKASITELDRLKSGDDTAYAALVERLAPKLISVARRYVRNEEDAKDCVQEAFVQVFRNIERFEGRSSLDTWIHRITVNAALQKLRRRPAAEELPIDDLLPSFDSEGFLEGPTSLIDTGAETLLERQEVREQVRAAIDKLPESYRNVIMLRDIEGLSVRDAAEMLDLSESNTKVRLHRARSALRRLLEPLLAEGTL